MNYSYDPTKIREWGKDRLRFELGDTIVSEGETALSDEEYSAFLPPEVEKYSKSQWMNLKLELVSAILHKLSFQVDTKIDVLSYDFSSRVDQWQKLYDTLKKEVELCSGIPVIAGGKKPSTSYFRSGMQSSPLTVPPFSGRGGKK